MGWLGGRRTKASLSVNLFDARTGSRPIPVATETTLCDIHFGGEPAPQDFAMSQGEGFPVYRWLIHGDTFHFNLFNIYLLIALNV